MDLARISFEGNYPRRKLRRSATSVDTNASASDLSGAIDLVFSHLALVQFELVQALAGSLTTRLLLIEILVSSLFLIGSSILFRAAKKRYASASS